MSTTLERPNSAALITGNPTGIERRPLHGQLGSLARVGVVPFVGAGISWTAERSLLRELSQGISNRLPAREPPIHRLGALRPSGNAQIIRLERIPVPGHTSYPLRRRFLATIIREGPSVRISLSGVGPTILPSGSGPDLETAWNHLGRHLHSMALEHRNIPPHVRGPESGRIQKILNHLVDWEQYERENPVIQPLWGRIRYEELVPRCFAPRLPTGARRDRRCCRSEQSGARTRQSRI
jgi:hypothetical protein